MICPECEEKELSHVMTLTERDTKLQILDIFFACYNGCGHKFQVTRSLCITPSEILDGINLHDEQDNGS